MDKAAILKRNDEAHAILNALHGEIDDEDYYGLLAGVQDVQVLLAAMEAASGANQVLLASLEAATGLKRYNVALPTDGRTTCR